MKSLLALFTLLLIISTSVYSQKLDDKKIEELRKKQVENIHNPELWDMERVKADLESGQERYPFKFGAYPVPHYDSLLNNSFGGLGNINLSMARSMPEYRLMVEDKELVLHSFSINRSPFYPEEVNNKGFFTILSVIDTVDAKGFAIGASQVLSRNHPDYGAQGAFITKNNKVEYAAFITPDKGSFAIVNMRLFHLEHGSIVIIAPQKDGSFRSLQIKSDGITDDGMEVLELFRTDILKRPEVKEFVTDDGVI